MTTALPAQHSHRVHLQPGLVAMAAAALLVGITAGAFFELSHDDAPTTTREPGVSLTLTPDHLRGSGHMQTTWRHAGTTAGGQTELGL